MDKYLLIGLQDYRGGFKFDFQEFENDMLVRNGLKPFRAFFEYFAFPILLLFIDLQSILP
jgi:hypothetical protein